MTTTYTPDPEGVTFKHSLNIPDDNNKPTADVLGTLFRTLLANDAYLQARGSGHPNRNKLLQQHARRVGRVRRRLDGRRLCSWWTSPAASRVTWYCASRRVNTTSRHRSWQAARSRPRCVSPRCRTSAARQWSRGSGTGRDRLDLDAHRRRRARAPARRSSAVSPSRRRARAGSSCKETRSLGGKSASRRSR